MILLVIQITKCLATSLKLANIVFTFQAVLLVSCLCLDYEIYDPQLWNNVLQRLQFFALVTIYITVERLQ